MKVITGGCACGQVRYEISGEPVLSLYCFCSLCRRRAGTDGYAGMMVAAADFTHTSGTTSFYRTAAESGREVDRHFCPNCGSHLWGETQIDLVSVAAGTLDDPTNFVPTRAVFTEDAPPWARIPDGLEQ